MIAAHLLRYHPNRYFRSRNFFEPLYNYFRSVATPDGLLPLPALEELQRRFVAGHWNPETVKTPVHLRPLGLGRLSQELSLFCHVARFKRCGRNIFHFSPTLTSLLKLTDVGDVLWKRINPPYSCIYLWFGAQSEWSLTDPRYRIDGTYVSMSSKEVVEILLSTVCSDIDYERPPSFVSHRDAYYYFPFEIPSEEATVGQTLDETVRTSESFDPGYTPPPIDAETKQLAESMGIEPVQLVEESSQRISARENLRNLPVFREALNLIVNCLCYLSSPSREVVSHYPDPESERQVAEARNRQERKELERRLARDGYTRINFCGPSLEREHEGLQPFKELAPHWRRGHWRNQAVGPGRTDHKLIWIRPTLVRKDKAGHEIVGHVYKVGDNT